MNSISVFSTSVRPTPRTQQVKVVFSGVNTNQPTALDTFHRSQSPKPVKFDARVKSPFFGGVYRAESVTPLGDEFYTIVKRSGANIVAAKDVSHFSAYGQEFCAVDDARGKHASEYQDIINTTVNSPHMGRKALTDKLRKLADHVSD